MNGLPDSDFTFLFPINPLAQVRPCENLSSHQRGQVGEVKLRLRRTDPRKGGQTHSSGTRLRTYSNPAPYNPRIPLSHPPGTSFSQNNRSILFEFRIKVIRYAIGAEFAPGRRRYLAAFCCGIFRKTSCACYTARCRKEPLKKTHVFAFGGPAKGAKPGWFESGPGFASQKHTKAFL